MKFFLKVGMLLLLVLVTPSISEKKQDECKGWPKALERKWPSSYNKKGGSIYHMINSEFLIITKGGEIWYVTTHDRSCHAAIIKEQLLHKYKIWNNKEKKKDTNGWAPW